MKSRLAITAMLVIGLGLSTTGGALALSGSSSDVGAAQAEYCTPGSTLPECDDGIVSDNPPSVLGEEESSDTSGGGGSGSGGDDGSGGQVQAARQSSSAGDDGNLPFTGYAAIPVILVGLMLLASGAFLFRESKRGDAA